MGYRTAAVPPALRPSIRCAARPTAVTFCLQHFSGCCIWPRQRPLDRLCHAPYGVSYRIRDKPCRAADGGIGCLALSGSGRLHGPYQSA